MPSNSRSPKERGASPQRRSSSSRSSPSKKSRSPRRQGSRGRGGFGGYRREQEPAAPNSKLFVTNIDAKFTKEELEIDLKELFQPFGEIKEIVVKTKIGSNNSYCFVEYKELESAEKAQKELKGKDFKGKELKVEFGRGERKNEDRRSDKCYICHQEGHFAKDCKYNRYPPSRNDRHRDDRGRDRDYDYRDRDHRDKRHRRRSYSRSSQSSRDHRRRQYRDRDRDDYRRKDRGDRDRYSPDRRRDYNSGRRY